MLLNLLTLVGCISNSVGFLQDFTGFIFVISLKLFRASHLPQLKQTLSVTIIMNTLPHCEQPKAKDQPVHDNWTFLVPSRLKLFVNHLSFFLVPFLLLLDCSGVLLEL